MGIKIKVHNVFHDEEDFSTNEVEEYLMQMKLDDRVDDVRISKGNQNSPLFITLTEDVNTITMENTKKIVKDILRNFSYQVSGVNVDRTVRGDNIMIQTV